MSTQDIDLLDIRKRGNVAWIWVKDHVSLYRVPIIAGIAVFFIGFLIGGVSFGGKTEVNSTEINNTSKICLDEECILSAANIIAKLNTSADPCVDFYDFVCGNYNEKLAEYDSRIDSFTIIQDMIDDKLRILLEKPIKFNDTRPTVLAKQTYQGCMDIEQLQRTGLPNLKKLMARFGGMPLLNNTWDGTATPWNNTIKILMESGANFEAFFSLNIHRTFHVQLYPPKPNKMEQFLRQGRGNEKVEEYYNLMLRTMIHMGAFREQAELELQDVIEFESKLVRLMLTDEELTTARYHFIRIDLKDVMKNYPIIDWIDFLNAFAPQDEKVDESFTVVLYIPTYFTNITELLLTTQPRTIANYLGWTVIRDYADYLDETMRDFSFQLAKISIGVKDRIPRYKTCIKLTSATFDGAIRDMLVRNVYTNEDQFKPAVSIAENILQQLLDAVKKTPLFHDDTRANAITKMTKTAFLLGTGDKLNEEDNKDYFQGLVLDPEDFFGSLANISRVNLHWNIHESHYEAEDRETRMTYARDVESFYDLENNSLLIPAGFLQGSFYNRHRPAYLNYGTLGTLIGHEITHGIDQIGRNYWNGTRYDWWNPYSRVDYDQKTVCFVYQYKNIIIPGSDRNLTGTRTEEENTADHTGLKFAYRAYKKWVETNGEEKTLPSLDYTPFQLFWIAYGQQWCVSQTNESFWSHVELETTSPHRYRVNIPLRNNKDFSNDFNCSLGSYMNQKQKCELY